MRFSRLAEGDLLGIGQYTVRTWGEAQAYRYLEDLESFCQKIADNFFGFTRTVHGPGRRTFARVEQ